MCPAACQTMNIHFSNLVLMVKGIQISSQNIFIVLAYTGMNQDLIWKDGLLYY
jgi:hypothetical protein